MSRHALRTFFTRVLPVTLPLVGACGGLPGTGCPNNVVDKVVVVPGDLGAVDDAGCSMLCTTNGAFRQVDTCKVMAADPDGGIGVDCQGLLFCIGGRRPEGFVETEHERWARMAELEAASVHAFDVLAEELHELGAPKRLIGRAVRAAGDEVRHARMVGALAGTSPELVKPIQRRRTAEEIAVENVVEGCVRETFGAAIAQLEARLHPDARVRAVMSAIFPDEEQHAELAHDVHSWLMPKLSAAAQRRVAAARSRALDELRAEAPRLRPLIDLMV